MKLAAFASRRTLGRLDFPGLACQENLFGLKAGDHPSQSIFIQSNCRASSQLIDWTLDAFLSKQQIFPYF